MRSLIPRREAPIPANANRRRPDNGELVGVVCSASSSTASSSTLIPRAVAAASRRRTNSSDRCSVTVIASQPMTPC